MWRIGTFVDQWMLSGRAIRVGSTRRPPRRAPIGKRPGLEAVEPRILLSAAEISMVQARPLEVRRLARSSVQISEVRGVGLGNRRAELMATLASNGQPVVGQAVTFRLGNRIVGRAKTDSNGVATLTNVEVGRLKFNNPFARPIVAVFNGNGSLRPAVRRGPLTTGPMTSSLAGVTGSGVYGGAATLSTALNPSGTALPGKLVSFVLDGRTVGTATTDAKGVATLSGVDLAGLDAGTYGVTARFAGDADTLPAITTGSLTIAKAAASITLGGLSQTYQGGGQVKAATSPGGLPISLSYTDASGNAVARPERVGTYVVTATSVDRNYSGTAVGTLVISPAVLSVSGVVTANKTYDGSTAATIDTGHALLAGVAAGDSVAIDASQALANFDAADVGVERPVAITGLTLTGADAGNYILSDLVISSFARITPRVLTVSGITAVDKVYDGSTEAAIDAAGAFLVGAVAGDSVALAGLDVVGSFASKSAGVDKTVLIAGLSLTGPDAGNYALGEATATATIAPKALAVAGISAVDKVYDGTTATSLDFSGSSFTGVILGDDVQVDPSAAFGRLVDKNVGVGKAVSIDGLVKSGADAGNYIFQFAAGVTADVSPRTVRVNGFTATDRTYDGTVDVALVAGAISLDADDLVEGDEVAFDSSTTASAVGVTADANAGEGKVVTITALGLGGADSGNYAPVATTTVDITRATITLSGVTASKIYDGTTDATLDARGASMSGVIGPDDVTLDASTATGTFDDKNVGVGKTLAVDGFILTGAHAVNYTLVVSPLTGTIASRVLRFTGLMATDRTYDGSTTVAVADGGVAFTPGDAVDGDDVSLDIASLASAEGTMADENAGFGKVVTVEGLAVIGADAGNYTIVATTTVNILKANLTVTGILDVSKPYDGHPYFTSINTSAASLNGIIGIDMVLLNTAGVFGVATSENVGTWSVFINGLSLTGIDQGNYMINVVVVTGTITGP